MGCSLEQIKELLLTEAKDEIKYNIYEIKEVKNSEQLKQLANEIDELEKYVHNELDERKLGYYYFTTGFDDIQNYIKDKDVTVMVCQENDEKIIAASYITQGQGFYTYNDLTKYFKFNEEFKKYGKSKYSPEELCSIEYETYMKKIEGYKYAKERITEELNITDLVGHCKEEKVKGTFDEKNKVRERVNRYICDYFRYKDKDRIGLIELDRFYLLKFSDLQNCEDKEIKDRCNKETEENKSLYKEYDDLIDLFDLSDAILPDDQNLDPQYYKTYFDANPLNTIELDTYIVHPQHRHRRLARIVSFEGLKIQKDKLLSKRPDLKEIFINGTVHKENVPSQTVASSFIKPIQKNDSNIIECGTLYIKRRKGIQRKVYLCKIKKDNLDKVFSKNEDEVKKLKKNLSFYNVVLTQE